MASYGCLHEWAGLLGNEEAAGLLHEILDQEKAANETLTGLARAISNEEALGESDDKRSAGDSARKATAPLRRAA
jgi:ferritin-like metal-binding protein YciE